ncbi:MAG: Flp pilus assembly complex ATPase component TadA [Erysipelotrichaceae bacterium]|nr:Flp pilus assembly complex ATPase component TadA [Erysipelotrichaceae bacterium]
MEKQFRMLLAFALKKQASDIHMILKEGKLQICLRTDQGYRQIRQDLFDHRLLEYLKFVSGMDLCAKWEPQSGSMETVINGRKISCRFSLIAAGDITTGVVRLLSARTDLSISQLTSDPAAADYLKSLCRLDHGLVLCAGPTGSGKTTTLHAVLHEMAVSQNRKIVSLESPVEIPDSAYLQLEVNEDMGFNYEKGLEQLLRHDPDVILIGECRSAKVARTLIQASLTGHLVFCTIHAANGREILARMQEFGIPEKELKMVMQAMFALRMMIQNSRKECIYETWNRKQIEEFINTGHTDVIPLEQRAAAALAKGWKEAGKGNLRAC